MATSIFDVNKDLYPLPVSTDIPAALHPAFTVDTASSLPAPKPSDAKAATKDKGIPSDIQTLLNEWRDSQKRIADYQKELDASPPTPSVTWADQHPVLSGLMTMIPGFQQGYAMRVRMNQRAQQLAEDHRQNMIRDRIALEGMRQRGDITPADYLKFRAESDRVRAMENARKQNLAYRKLMEQYSRDRAEAEQRRAESSIAFNQWRMKHPFGGRGSKSAVDPSMKMFTYFRSLYEREAAKTQGLQGVPGVAPMPSFSEWAQTHIPPKVYDMLKNSGYLVPENAGAADSSSGADFTDYLWNQDIGLQYVKGPK